MGLALIILAAVAVVVIALVAVGRAIGELEAQDAPVVLRVEDAVEWIGDHLPDEVGGRLSYDDVTLVVEWHLQWFAEVGMATEYGEELAAGGLDDAIAPLDEAHDYVVAALARAEIPIDPVDAVVVVDLHTSYLRLIGAYGDPTP